MIVAKFGGTSLASADRFAHVAQIIRADPNRRYVVVSAPGKRSPEDTKRTDLLYRFQKSGQDWDFEPITARFQGLCRPNTRRMICAKNFPRGLSAKTRRQS